MFSDKEFISPSNKYQDTSGEVLVQLLTEQEIKKSIQLRIKLIFHFILKILPLKNLYHYLVSGIQMVNQQHVLLG